MSTCSRAQAHSFDPTSGWCTHGCGWRDDGAHEGQLPHPRQRIDPVDITEPRRTDDA